MRYIYSLCVLWLITGQAIASTIVEFHAAFATATKFSASRSGSSNLLPTSRDCPSGNPVFGFSTIVSSSFPSCAVENSKVCPVPTGECTTSSCSLSSSSGVKTDLLCGTPISGSETVSISQSGGDAQSLSCPNGKVILFGIATQHTPSKPADCPQNNKLCGIGATSCSTEFCDSGEATIKTIRLLCGSSSLASALDAASSSVKVTSTGAVSALNCNSEGSRSTLLIGMQFLWEGSSGIVPRQQICPYGSSCTISGSIPGTAQYLGIALCVEPASPTPVPSASPTSRQPTAAPSTLAPTQAPTTLAPTTVPPTNPPNASPTPYPTAPPTLATATGPPTLVSDPDTTSNPTAAPTPGPSAGGSTAVDNSGNTLVITAVVSVVASLMIVGGGVYTKRNREGVPVPDALGEGPPPTKGLRKLLETYSRRYRGDANRHSLADTFGGSFITPPPGLDQRPKQSRPGKVLGSPSSFSSVSTGFSRGSGQQGTGEVRDPLNSLPTVVTLSVRSTGIDV